MHSRSLEGLVYQVFTTVPTLI